MQNENVCPYCGGAGQIIDRDRKNFTFDKSGKPLEEYRYYTCFCINNKIVSKSFTKLYGIPDITPDGTIKAGKFGGFKNLVIYGNEQKFLHLVKATMVLHANYHHTFEFVNGTELVHKYFVEQPRGITRHLPDLENKDMVIFIFDASTENKAQSRAVFEVVKNRFRMNNPEKLAKKEKIERPTWVYSSNSDSLKSSKEYSPELAPYLSRYEERDLKSYAVPFDVVDVDTSTVNNIQFDLGS
jgi:hypothetical protein